MEKFRELSILLLNLAKFNYSITNVMRHKMFNKNGYNASEDYWNERATFYDQQYGKELLLSNLETIISEDINRYQRIMELMYGIGGNLRVLASHFSQISFTGIDHSNQMLNKGKDNLRVYHNIRLIRADLETLDPYGMEKQDLVFSRAVLQHLSSSVVRNVVSFIFGHVTERLYVEEVSIQGYLDGKSLKWPGFPEDLYYSHDYLHIVSKYADIRHSRYKHGIIIQLFCVKKIKAESCELSA
jgi:hypothetical protein